MKQFNWKKNVAIFLGSQAISLFGSSLVQYAITWYITLTTQSGIYITLSILCSQLPMLLLSPFAGVWADRYERKRLIAMSDGAIALSTLALAITFFLGYKSIWLLFAVSAIRGMGSAVQSPSISATLPDLVPEEELTRYNGLNSSLTALLTLASPALSGVLLGVTGSIELILLIDVLTATIAITILLRFLQIPTHNPPTEGTKTRYYAEIREGLAYIHKHRYLLHMLGYSLIICFMVAPVSFLMPLQVVRSYGNEVWRLTGAQVAYAVGMLSGGLFLMVWSGLRNRVHTSGLAILLIGACTVLLGIGVPFGIYVGLMAISGFFLPFFSAPSTALLQERIDSVYMGRIFSVVNMITSSMGPLAMVLFGPLADLVPIEWLLMSTGAVVIAVSIILLCDRTVLAVGIPQRSQEPE